jgi:hypothetical protein
VHIGGRPLHEKLFKVLTQTIENRVPYTHSMLFIMSNKHETRERPHKANTQSQWHAARARSVARLVAGRADFRIPLHNPSAHRVPAEPEGLSRVPTALDGSSAQAR